MPELDVTSSQQAVTLTLCGALEAASRLDADAEGWTFGSQRVTFEAMRSESIALARCLEGFGVQANDVVAIWAPNVPIWAVALFACSYLGAVLQPLNTRGQLSEIAFMLEDSQAKGIIFIPQFLNVDFRPILEQLGFPVTSGLLDSTLSEPHWLSLEAKGESKSLIPLLNLQDFSAGETSAESQARPSDAVLLQYTSGSTARPKGALLSNQFVLNYSLSMWTRMGIRRGEPVLNPQPFYHVGGSCASIPPPLVIGCRVVIPEVYEPEYVLELLEREACVGRGGMPTMYFREMQHPRFTEYGHDRLRTGWTIGDPVTLQRIRDCYPLEGIVQIYGATEGGLCFGSVDDPWEARRSTAGRAAPGCEVVIKDPESRVQLGPEAVGEICWRGWATLIEYVGASHHEAPFDEDGFFHSGDLGFLDEDRRLHFVGRLKEMIKPGGENVAAQEIEALLLEHPSVNQVAVLGVPDPDLNEAVLAVVETVPGLSVTAEDLIAFCGGRVAKFKVPRHIRFVESWPLTASGKIRKPELRDRFVLESETPDN